MAGAKYVALLLILSGSGLAATMVRAEADGHRLDGAAHTATTASGTLSAYAVNFRRHWVVPITIASRTARAAIPVPYASGAIAITPDAATAFVASGQDGVATLTPITLATGQPGPAIHVAANGIAITPDGATAYATGPLGVTPVDVRTRQVRALIPVPLGADAIAITPDGTHAFVTSQFGQDKYGWVTPIRLADRSVGPRIRVPAGTAAIAITPNGRTVYVASDYDGAVTPIDVKTSAAGRPIPVDIWADSLAIAPNGARAYVGTIDSVEIIDLRTNTVVGSLQGGWVDFPDAGLAITPDGATAFVSDDESTGGPFVQAFTLRTGQPGNIISKGGPGGIAITPAQAPTARFAVTAAAAGATTTFDASASTPGTGRIIRYAWFFGDGAHAVTTKPFVDHVYSAAGTYAAALQVTNSARTSTEQIFTGQTMSRNGRPRARHVEQLVIK